MLIKENSNLKEDIDNYKNCRPEPKVIEIILRGVLTASITMAGLVFTPIIGYSLFDNFKPMLSTILAISLSTGIIIQSIIYNYWKKENNKKFETAKKNLQLIIEVLNKNKIEVDENTISSAIIDESKTKGISDNIKIKTTITNFYLLDKNEQIRVLKEVKKTIKKTEEKTTTGPDLYLEENININELPVKKTLKLK